MKGVLFLFLVVLILAVAGCADTKKPTDNQIGNTLLQVPDANSPEGSGNNTIFGRWYQTGRGDGAKIWYDFYQDGTFTFNYDMRGNRDTVLNKGNWTYLGNSTFRLVSSISGEPGTHGNENITLSPDGRSFRSGIEYSSLSSAGRDIIFAKE